MKKSQLLRLNRHGFVDLDRLNRFVEQQIDRVRTCKAGNRHNETLEASYTCGGWIHYGLDETRLIEKLKKAAEDNPANKSKNDILEREREIKEGIKNGKLSELTISTNPGIVLTRNHDLDAITISNCLSKTGQFFNFPAGDEGVYYLNDSNLTCFNDDELANYLICHWDIESDNGKPVVLTDQLTRKIRRTRNINLPTIESISKLPVLKNDLTWLQSNGYDSTEKVLMTQSFEINQAPTLEETHRALDYLMKNLVGQFCFEEKAVASAILLSMMFALLTVKQTELRPGLISDAGSSDSGKSSVIHLLQVLAGEDKSSSDPNKQQKDPSEMGAELLNAMREGQRVLFFDNLPDGYLLSSSTLSAIMTNRFWKVRKFHTQDFIHVPNDFIVAFTGTNINLGGDNDRRFLVIRMRKELMFKWVDPVKFAEVNRTACLDAIGTLLSAYINAGYPVINGKLMNSFTRWDKMCRQCVLWLGKEFPEFELGDPCANVQRQKTSNPQKEEWRSVLQILKNTFGTDTTFVSRDIPSVKSKSIEDYDELKEILKNFAANRKQDDPLSSTNIGYYLKKIVGNPMILDDGRAYRLEKQDSNVSKFKIILDSKEVFTNDEHIKRFSGGDGSRSARDIECQDNSSRGCNHREPHILQGDSSSEGEPVGVVLPQSEIQPVVTFKDRSGNAVKASAVKASAVKASAVKASAVTKKASMMEAALPVPEYEEWDDAYRAQFLSLIPVPEAPPKG